MKAAFLSLLAVAFVSSCAAERPATGPELISIRKTCETYGFKAGSSQHASCVYQMDQERMTSNRDRRLRFARSMSMMGAGIQAQNNQQQMINAMNRPINTTCSRNGYYTNCTSY